MNVSRALLPLFVLLALPILTYPARAQQEKKQYAIVLKLAPRLLDDANWTEEDNKAVGAHFARLKKLTASGTVMLAGRTLNGDASQFGLVIVEVESEAEAREVMDGDPAVKAGVMTADLFPYRVALMRESSGKD